VILYNTNIHTILFLIVCLSTESESRKPVVVRYFGALESLLIIRMSHDVIFWLVVVNALFLNLI